MGSRIFIILTTITFILACESEGDIHLPEGNYSGYFTRSTVEEDGVPSRVTLTFAGNTFTGSSEVPKYPAICHGTYTIEGDKITFINSCPWTADFDWTLVLSGEYIINVDDEQVKFFRDYDGKQTDVYLLKKNN
jgi:hypothetical protein